MDVTATIDRGAASLAEHRAYLAGLGAAGTDPDAFLRDNARASGAKLGVQYAVEFEMVRL